MKVAVLTYDVPHRKTYDTLCLLKTRGYDDVDVFAVPLTYRKKTLPTVAHRPDMSYLTPESDTVCAAFGFQYRRIDTYEQSEGADVYLVCGAGIIPQDFVDSHRIVNAHPGYVPLVRGLDALKWAVLEDLPIGVTAHFLGDEVDAGEVIERRKLDLMQNESFFELGIRVYRNEIDMLVSALEKLDDMHETLKAAENVLHRRMPEELERKMLQKYDNLVSMKEGLRCSLEI